MSHLPFPRKGTETRYADNWKDGCFSHTYLFPARGRKQKLIRLVCKARGKVTPTFSPQGDGNLIRKGIAVPINESHLPFPRKGTETP